MQSQWAVEERTLREYLLEVSNFQNACFTFHNPPPSVVHLLTSVLGEVSKPSRCTGWHDWKNTSTDTDLYTTTIATPTLPFFRPQLRTDPRDLVKIFLETDSVDHAFLETGHVLPLPSLLV